MTANDNEDDTGNPDSEILSAALAQGLEHEAQQKEDTRKQLQEKLNEGVRLLRALARQHDLVWPEDEN